MRRFALLINGGDSRGPALTKQAWDSANGIVAGAQSGLFALPLAKHHPH